MNSATLLVFARLPQAGMVKTRLCPPLTATEAARVHRVCLEAVMHGVLSLGGVDAVLVGTPDGSGPAFQRLFGRRRVRVWDQGAGTLGDRLARAMRRAFGDGATRVAAIGTDTPQMDAGYIEAAWAGLDDADAVLGPTDDGGYCLIGLRHDPQWGHDPGRLFENIDWGTSRVAEQTRARIRSQEWSGVELPTLYDVDRAGDLWRIADGPVGGFLTGDVQAELRRIALTAASRAQTGQ